MDEPIDNGFADHRIFKEFKPSLGFDLRSDDERGLAVALFKDGHQGGGLLVGIVSESQVIKDQGHTLGSGLAIQQFFILTVWGRSYSSDLSALTYFRLTNSCCINLSRSAYFFSAS